MRRAVLPALFTFMLMLVPSWAMAAGSEANVTLNFSDSDKIYLWISFGLGFIALITGWWFRSKVTKESPGNEKMQEVGLAIYEGAMAYLKQQISTMIWFVLAIAGLLTFIYGRQYDSWALGGLTAASFMLGVAASYIAGYVGMDMAVKANMRTAHAALTSYAKALEVSFQAGAVAGLITVGMGLVGATAILAFFSADAMKLLIGFGFGGSLAALFMRVGGGIFTKAADVGADLVGKVEAGIPEDDARNPATIADNVGDNVGDCAGMAADVFESYEVTLVAAIVLGAATAQIFDQTTWMKLILFALMARGVGIIASIAGIMMVKGSDDIDSDPLKPISGGFKKSALIAAVGTLILAYFMMGGKEGSKINSSRLVSGNEVAVKLTDLVHEVRDEFAKSKGIKPEAVMAEDISADKRIADLELPKQADQADPMAPHTSNPLIQNLINIEPEELVDSPQLPKLEGYKPVSLDSKELERFTAMKQTQAATGATNEYKSVKDVLKDYRVYQAEVMPPAQPGSAASPMQKIWFLSSDLPALKAQITPMGGKISDEKGVGVVVYLKDKQIALGMEVPSVDSLVKFQPAQGAITGQQAPDQIFAMSKAELEEKQNLIKAKTDEVTKLYGEADKLKGPAQEAKRKEAAKVNKALSAMKRPTPVKINQGAIEHMHVEWWRFAFCIIFGILMAFIIERLTDYYVSLNGKPVREVAGVSSAGPAPMIISGFALACESSVFSVLAIVASLIMPLVLFPAAAYGGYILSFYGIALVGLGLLTTTGYILAMDTFGPISDNAQGVFEMSGAGHDNPKASKAVQRLDAAGNTTKALTKGFAIATAVVAAVALFHSFVEDAHLNTVGMGLQVPEIFLGLLIGGAAPFLFSAFSINAVGRAAFELINEVRRQFKSDPGIMAGTSKPDYGICVSIVTAAAQKELLGPGILAIALPVAVGFGFSIGQPLVNIGGNDYNLVGAQALGGFLAGAILSGQLLAVLLANSGGMWDNAKKLVEDGLYGGKGSDAHKAAIVCDTVGDPFKDTAGPAMNPLIKVMNLVALLLAPIIIVPHSLAVQVGVTVVCVSALTFSIWWSKRGSMASGLSEAGTLPEPPVTPVKKSDSGKRITVEDNDEA